jgi:hypothetical protein
MNTVPDTWPWIVAEFTPVPAPSVPDPPPHAASTIPNTNTVTIPMIPRLPVICFSSLCIRRLNLRIRLDD